MMRHSTARTEVWNAVDVMRQVTPQSQWSKIGVQLPAVGLTFSVSVAAPGTGRVTYRVMDAYCQKLPNGSHEGRCKVQVVNSTVRELTESDVI